MDYSTKRKSSHLQRFHLIEYIIFLTRFNKITKYITKDINLLDVGCGYNANLLFYFKEKISKGYGIDLNVNLEKSHEKINLISSDLNSETFPESLNNFDIITCLAVLEHVVNPENLLQKIYKALKTNGKLLLTVPSWLGKPVLEFLAYKIHLISKEEILDHKTYFNKKELVDLLSKVGFKNIKHEYYLLGMNNFIYAEK